MRRGWSVLIAALVSVLLVLASCSGGQHGRRGTGAQAGHAPAPAPVPLILSVGPAAATRGAPVTTEITTTVTGGRIAGVTLVDSAGATITGSERPDGTSWVPAQPLDYAHSYTATVTAVGGLGTKREITTTFTTMADPGSDRIGTGLYLFTGQTYGVGMPVVIEFDTPIDDQFKAAVERRLFVQSSPAQVGVWHWYGDRQVLYRPQNYWQPGTVLTVRAALGGLPVGKQFTDVDRAATVTIGPNQSYLVSNKDKTLYVYQNGRQVKAFPVSLGKPSTPTSSGNFVLMSHDYSTVFQTSEYTTTAYYDERFTWDGQYLHAAPWSVGDQGSTNVSHGCVNLSVESARWIFENSRIGDPLTVSGTEAHLTPGDGWTVWDESWDDYRAGSALPHPELAPSATGRAPAGYPVAR